MSSPPPFAPLLPPKSPQGRACAACVACSVVKWVHLNRGDAGLEALLAKFWRLLAPGGCLLLEPQPWKSYKAAAAKMRKQVGWRFAEWVQGSVLVSDT